MALLRQVRADFDGATIRVCQAYPAAIADAAPAAGRFVAPFSFTRVTWVKPSLSRAVLTARQPAIHGSAAAWSAVFEQADVHVQWDPERTLRGAALNQYSIQVGIGRALIRTYAEEWVVGLTPLPSPTARRLRADT